MLFVTNHSKKDGRESQVGEKFVFEHKDKEVGQQIYFVMIEKETKQKLALVTY